MEKNIYIYIYINHFAVYQKLIQCCKSTILQLKKIYLKKETMGTSLVAQWIRSNLPVQQTRVQTLVWEDSTCCGATKPMPHNY